MPYPLDDPGFLTRLDPHGMYDLTVGFADQCRHALEIVKSVSLPELETRPGVVVLSGMGGSAAGGDLVRALFEDRGAAPFIVNRDYHLPNYVGLADLVFCASYSGNTEETLSAYADAKNAGARVIAVTSGGQLAKQAEDDGFTVIRIPGGQPPRTALGYMFVPVVNACERLGLLPNQDYENAFKGLDRVAAKWKSESPQESNQAKQLAAELNGAVGILYGLGSYPGLIANRWRSQINENAKQLAFCNALPEMNHNEILGWVEAGKQQVRKFVGVFLEDGDEPEKMKARARITENLIAPSVKFHRVRAEGDSLLERLLTLTHFGDYLSIYLAALVGVDPENIDSINTLKGELAKI